MSERYFVSRPLPPGPLIIAGAEAHHLAAVCRLTVDEPLTLFNGDGNDYPAKVTGIERRRVIVEVGEAVKVNRESARRIDIASPLPRGDRAQFLIEKLTELGATSFTPLVTRRSVVKPHDSKRDKLERYVIEASKQCGRNVLMEIHRAANWEEYCRRELLPQQRYLAHPGGEGGLPLQGFGPAVFAIGPEGGFAEDEVQLAENAGWKLLGLGPRILRVETAALSLATCALMTAQNASHSNAHPLM